MSRVYKLYNGIFQKILCHCRQVSPREACGLIGGTGPLGTKVFPVTNTDDSPKTYSMAPEEVLGAMQCLDTEGLELNAVYHSHPDTEAYPSARDIDQAYLPAVYLILSLRENKPQLRGFFINDGEVTEVTVKIIDEGGETHAG